MQWVLAGLVALATLTLVVGGITGHVKARNCCSVPADQDRRLQA
ncbi:MAG: hypothetical protein ACKOAW_02180 [Actinomycetota bacterium]